MSWLIVGYGNELREDDGIGPRVVRAVADLPGVETIVVHSLLPELAEPISRASHVLFVDASLKACCIEIEELSNCTLPILGHVSNPGHLLALSETLFDSRPQAWLLSIPARNFGFSTSPSPGAEAQIVLATQAIQQMVK